MNGKLQKVKNGIKKHWKAAVGMMMSVVTMACMAVSSFAADATVPVQYSDFESIFTALQGQISVSSIVGVLAAVVGACVGLVFMWWGLRKVVSMLMAAFRKGKVSV